MNPMAAADLVGALNLLRDNLPHVPANPENGSARVNLCVAAFIYNRAWDTGANGSALGVVSALAHSLDTRYAECSHGAAYSITTAPGMRFNRDHNLGGQARFADAFGARNASMTDGTAADAAAESVSNFFRQVGMPTRLRDVGVPAGGITAIAEDALTDFAGGITAIAEDALTDFGPTTRCARCKAPTASQRAPGAERRRTGLFAGIRLVALMERNP